MKDVLPVLAGGLFVLVYAWHRFSNPSENRSSTTAARYYTAGILYCLWTLSLYGGLVAGLTLSPDVVKGFSEASGTELYRVITDLQTKGLSYPLIVALLLTTLLPNIPAIASVDRLVREQLEHMAAIPYEVRRLSADLERSDSIRSGVRFIVPASIQDRVRQRLLEQDFLSEDVSFENELDLPASWTKLSVLILHLADWRSERKFSGFYQTCAEKPDEITQAYEELLPRVRRCLRNVHAGATHSRDADARGAMSEYRGEVERQVKSLLGRVYRFISAATLQCEFTQDDRTERLAKLGFHFSEPWNPSPVLLAHRLVALFIGLAVIPLTIFGFLAQLYPHGSVDYPRALRLSVMIPLSYVIAVFWALLLKNRWHRITRRREGTRPYLSYFLSGLLAVATNVPVTLIWRYMNGTSAGSLKADLTRSVTWLMLSFVTAFMTAFLIDDQPRSLARRWGGKWSEGAAQALVTAATSFLVYQVLHAGGHPPKSPLGIAMLLGGSIGFVIGTLIPTWYREAPRHRGQLEEPEPTWHEPRRRRRFGRKSGRPVEERRTAA
jgi:hypothetical protein